MAKILAIDDINDNLISLKAIIDDAFPGSIVFTALNGAKGIELAIAKNPDVILLDIIMPIMDGFEVCRRLKENELVRDIPVVFITAIKGDKESRIKALEVGAEGFLSKPIDETELTAQIRAMVKIKAANEQKRNEKERLQKLVEERTASLQTELEERIRTEMALKESEERFKLIFEASNVAQSITRLSGEINVNQAFSDMFGYTEGELKGKKWQEITLPEEIEIDQNLIDQILKGEKNGVRRIKRYVHKNGSILWGDVSYALIRDHSGNPLHFITTIIDITENIQAEETIIRNEERFKQVADLSGTWIWEVDAKGLYTYVNDYEETILGYVPDEIIGKKYFYDFFAPEVKEDLKRLVFEGFSQKRSFQNFENPNIHKDGHRVILETIGFPILDHFGNLLGYRGADKDITERKRAEEELQKSYDLLNKLAAQVPGVVYQYRLYPDGHSAFPFSSPGMYDIYEVTPEEVREDASPVFSRIHPDDYDFIVETITESARSQTIYQSEFRVILPNQGLCWRQCNAKPELLEDGSTLWYGIITDITDRKLTEEALRENNSRLELAMKAANMSWWKLDMTTGNVLFEQGKAEMLDYPPENFKHYNDFMELVHPEDYERTMNAMKTHLNGTAEKYEVEYRIKTKSGEYKWFYDIGSVTRRDSQGMPLTVTGLVLNITERKKSEAELREKEVQYRNLANSGVALIWTAGTNKLCNYFNEPWLKFTGRTLEQEMGNGWTEGVHPDDLENCVQTYLTAFDKRQSFEMEYRLHHVSGEYRWIQDMGTPNYNSEGNFIGYIGHCFDITERKEMEAELITAKEKAEKSGMELLLRNQELIERNKFIQIVLDNLPLGIALNKIDEGTATYMNKKFEEIYGWSSDEIVSIDTFFKHVYPDADYRNKLIERIMRDIQSGDPGRMHWENIYVTRKDGSKRVINAANIPLIEQNTMVSTVTDITELHKTQHDLLTAKEKAEESDRLKSSFLANMSHEIRTPLNSILGFSDLLNDPEFSAEQQVEFVQMIKISGNNLLSIISDIMDISKIESGQVSIEINPFPVNQLINEIQREYYYKAHEKGVDFRLDSLIPQNEVYLNSDESKLKQVLINLVSNSIKFTGEGFIELGFIEKEDLVQFHIRDSGIGIPEEYHNKIFERFRQVESADSRKYGGNGLGLAISKSLVELLGGSIWMESEQGAGSTFYFVIPKTHYQTGASEIKGEQKESLI